LFGLDLLRRWLNLLMRIDNAPLRPQATDYGDPGFDNSWGFGEVNAFKATIKAEKLR
jgi:hypothetical protein